METATPQLTKEDSNPRRLLTICAWTGQVKMGEHWLPIQRYLLLAHGVVVTHGISPDGIPKALASSC
jgi:hypothetical protein